jgi:uncharacterized BrkB/YihY/UPF0761 family membrane protein
MTRRAGTRRERLHAMLADGQAHLERARSRSLAVDLAVRFLRRDRLVAVGILAGSLAFRLFALMVPLGYVLVAGLGLRAGRAAGGDDPGRLGDLIVSSIASAGDTSVRGRWLALLIGGTATLLAGVGVAEVLRWIHLLAWRLPPARALPNPWQVLGLVTGVVLVLASSALAEQARAGARGLASELTVIVATAAAQVVLLAAMWLLLSWVLPRPAVPWTALVPGSLLFAGGFLGFTLAVRLYFVPRAARASAFYGSLGVALVLLVSLFLFARLAVAAAELNATIWEHRQRRRPAGPGVRTGGP